MNTSHNDLVWLLHQAMDTNHVVDVSGLTENGGTFELSNNESSKHGVHIDILPIVSDTYNSYNIAMKILGPEYDIYSKLYSTTQPPEFLIGPLSLTVHYDRETGRKIYIFGERHGFESHCGNTGSELFVGDYLDNLFNETSVPIDFYLESNVEFVSEASRMRILGIPTKCHKCFLHRLIYYQLLYYYSMPMVRSHYIDPRAADPKLGRELNNIFSKIVLGIQDDGIMVGSKSQENVTDYLKFRDILSSVDLSTENAYFNYIESILRDTRTYLGKEISRSYKSDQIIEHMKTRMRREYHRSYPILQLYLSQSPVTWIKLFSAASLLGSFLLDAYIIARIFKVFDMSKINPNKSPLFTAIPTNMIVYVGDLHAQELRTFVKNNGFELIESVAQSQGHTECLDIHSIKQPFFTSIS